MRFGANTWIWVSPLTNADLAQLVPHVAALGFDWIELPLEYPNSFDYEYAHSLITAHGLGVSIASVISPERDLLINNAAIRQTGMDYVRHAIVAASKVGAHNLIGPFYSAVGRTWLASDDERKRDLDLLEQQLRTLAPIAADHGVTLCLEPLNRFETSFINLAEQALSLIERVDHPAFQLMLDTFHMNIEEQNIGNAIRKAGKHLRHFHASENDRGTPGEGHVPWADVATALHDIDYRGPIVIETFTSKVTTIARAAAIWRPLAPSGDHLAANGLTFLRNLLTPPPNSSASLTVQE